jgi:hypothetical protein
MSCIYAHAEQLQGKSALLVKFWVRIGFGKPAVFLAMLVKANSGQCRNTVMT